MVSSVSFYKQNESWHAAQKAVTDNLYGSTSSAGATTDFSSAFTGIAGGYYTSIGNLSGQAALARVQSQIQTVTADQSTVSLTAGADFAKSAGNAILAQLGWYGASDSSSSGSSYTAPVNAATGYSYVQTSAANLNALNALNLFA
ncbi:MAG TPA: hypothetical protein VHA77_16365 [Xanthobacteraceae bacterium]|nr:hypothetical protein [Xanthobacteraceae bacterium]